MARHLLRLWRCYVDDTYTVMKKARAQEFMEYLNTVDADIKWMTEGEVEMVITKDADEEIVWDRVERALAFWTPGRSSSLMDQSRQRCSGRIHNKPAPQLQ